MDPESRKLLHPMEQIWHENALLNKGAEVAFNELGAQVWIDQFRIESGGRLDIDATADAVCVPVYRWMPPGEDGKPIIGQGCITGLGVKKVEPIAIHLDPEWGADEHDVTFGHELGHLFLELETSIVQGLGTDRVIEDFCEYFGRQVAVPKETLATLGKVSVELITELMGQFNARHTTIIYQLMAAGKLPRKLFLDTKTGDVPNKFYANKVHRHCLCLDCELGTVHDHSTPQVIPIYNFTSFDWSDNTPNGLCEPNTWDDIQLFARINRQYGTWSDELDTQLEAEAKHDDEIRRLLGLRSLRGDLEDEDDFPF